MSLANSSQQCSWPTVCAAGPHSPDSHSLLLLSSCLWAEALLFLSYTWGRLLCGSGKEAVSAGHRASLGLRTPSPCVCNAKGEDAVVRAGTGSHVWGCNTIGEVLELLGPQRPLERVGRGSCMLASLLTKSKEPGATPWGYTLSSVNRRAKLDPPASAYDPYPLTLSCLIISGSIPSPTQASKLRPLHEYFEPWPNFSSSLI